MTQFSKKTMKKEPALCVRIQALRQATGISLPMLATRTRIPLHHLQALESCEYHRLPEGIYRKAMVQKVLRALDTNPDAFAEELEVHTPPSNTPQWKERLAQRYSLSYFARATVVILIMGAVGSYIGMHLYGLMRSPDLVINSPQEGQVVSSPEVTIKGKTDVDASVHINGIEVLATNTGEFIQVIPLHEGSNEVSIRAQKKFGGSREKMVSVFFKPDTPVTEQENNQVSLAPHN